MGARLANRLGQGLLRHAELGQQAVVALGLFDRVQVLPLQVLHQRHRGGVGVRQFLHQHRHFLQAGQGGGTPSPLAGDDVVAVRVLADSGRASSGCTIP